MMKRSCTTLNLLGCDGEWKEKEKEKENVQYINFQIREGGCYEILTLSEAIAKVSNPKPRPISISIIINPTRFYYKHVKKAQDEERQEKEEREIESTTEIHVSGISILFAIVLICYVF